MQGCRGRVFPLETLGSGATVSIRDSICVAATSATWRWRQRQLTNLVGVIGFMPSYLGKNSWRSLFIGPVLGVINGCTKRLLGAWQD